MPRLSFAPATEELATAAATLSTGWRRQRASIDNLAASAQAIVDGLPDPLIAVDRQRRIVRTNLAARALLGHGRRRARPVDGVPPAAAAGRDRRAAGDRRRRQLHRRRPDRRRARADGPARARHDRPSAAPAARGGRRLAGAGRAARHDGAAPRRAHARRFRRQCQPRAQDADRGPRRLHRDPARPGARRRRRARALPRHHGRAGRPHAPPGRRSPDAVAHRAARACPPRRRDRSRQRAEGRARPAAAEGLVAQGGARAQPRSRHCRARSATTTSSPSCSRTWSTTP